MLSQIQSKSVGRLMLGLGVGLLLVAVGGLLIAQAGWSSQGPALAPTQPPTRVSSIAQSTPGASGAVARALPLLPSHTPTATHTPRPSPTPKPTFTPSPTDEPTAAPTSAKPTATLVRSTNEPIEWTQEEQNALSWMCYGEVSGMGNSEYDACLSVLSTVRARYAYPNNFAETDVISTLMRPNQFNVPIETTQPAPEPRFLAYVEDYAQGARGSCNGYLYFNSIPGGPSSCVIYGAAGLFIQFHNRF